jgi:DNA-3-methyladenine glycosylase
MMIKNKPLPRSFYARDAAVVARELLGKILVHRKDEILTGKIVETEAYYGEKDPASRAYRRTKLAEPMFGQAGKVFIYMVHANWMFNIVTGKRGEPSAVLIRALEPLRGIEIMKKNRGVKDIRNLCNGPGKLSQALGITKDHQGLELTKSELYIADSENEEKIKIATSYRIGVTRDLKRKLRFYILGSKFVSKRYVK